jgi:hypothetical protein
MKKNNGLPSVDRGACGHEKCGQREQSHPSHGFILGSGEGFMKFEAVCLCENERK